MTLDKLPRQEMSKVASMPTQEFPVASLVGGLPSNDSFVTILRPLSDDRIVESVEHLVALPKEAFKEHVIASAQWIGSPLPGAERNIAEEQSGYANDVVLQQHEADVAAMAATNEILAAKADDAMHAAKLAEEAKAQLEEENMQLKAKCKALQDQMEQEAKTREDITTIQDRVNACLDRLGSYEEATSQAMSLEPTLRIQVKEDKTLSIAPQFPPETDVPMITAPYAGPLHGLHAMNQNQNSVLLLPPLSQHLVCQNLTLSEDAYTARRSNGCSQAVVMGSAPLESQAGGLFFEVRISGTAQDMVEGGLAIGVTQTAPEALQEIPSSAEDIPLTVAVGYSGSVYLNGCERQINWNAEHLETSHRVGLLITDDGRGDLVVFEDQKPVVRIDGFALRDAGLLAAPLYPVIELFGATSGVTLVPRAVPSSQAWDHLEPAEFSLPVPLLHSVPDALAATKAVASKEQLAAESMLSCTSKGQLVADLMQSTRHIDSAIDKDCF